MRRQLRPLRGLSPPQRAIERRASRLVEDLLDSRSAKLMEPLLPAFERCRKLPARLEQPGVSSHRVIRLEAMLNVFEFGKHLLGSTLGLRELRCQETLSRSASASTRRLSSSRGLSAKSFRLSRNSFCKGSGSSSKCWMIFHRPISSPKCSTSRRVQARSCSSKRSLRHGLTSQAPVMPKRPIDSTLPSAVYSAGAR